MSTEYYLRALPEEKLTSELSKNIRRSLISEHSLDLLWDILSDEQSIDDDSVNVLNKGIRGPYPDGHYCGFNFEDEFNFWTKLIRKFPNNGFLNLIYAEYLVQKEKGYFKAHEYYKKAFEINYRLIFGIEPSWRDELLDHGFDYEIYYLRTQKDDYEEEDFKEIVSELIEKYKNEPEKVEKIKLTTR